MDNLEQKIQEYFNQVEVKKYIDELINKYLTDENQKKGFLDVFELIKKGEFNIDDLYDYLNEWHGVEIENALKFDDELFDKVYGDIYDELQELYRQKQKEKEAEGTGEVEQETAQSVVSEPFDLTQRYQRFVQSSLFQNILAAQERMKEKYGNVETQHAASLPDEFYTAINAGDKIKLAGILRLICEQGKLREFFEQDERYVDFFGGVLARHQGEDKKQKFIKDPAHKKYLIEFLKFILEKRVGFSNNEAAMLGVSLGSLCREAGENEYADMAYGDESSNGFKWA